MIDILNEIYNTLELLLDNNNIHINFNKNTINIYIDDIKVRINYLKNIIWVHQKEGVNDFKYSSLVHKMYFFCMKDELLIKNITNKIYKHFTDKIPKELYHFSDKKEDL
jgi:hypothetical protein